MIPKIIHQIWDEKINPLPHYLCPLMETWKMNHLDYTYEFWDNQRIISFLKEYYLRYYEKYFSFYYDIQRCDIIRYLILYKVGGIYVDCDFESFSSIEPILRGKECCFSVEPKVHYIGEDQEKTHISNAFIATVPNHLFFEKIIEYIFSISIEKQNHLKDRFNKVDLVLKTTGPEMLSELYNKYEKKNSIYTIPTELISPLSKIEVESYLNMESNNIQLIEYLEKKLEKAVALHYFLGTWI